MQLYRGATAVCLLTLAASAQQKPDIVGEISSTAPIEIDGTSMAPAPSWPLVDRDVIRTTSAPGLILTPDRNRLTLMPDTSVRIRTLPTRQTWIFLREGGLAVDTDNRSVMICVANRVFQPSAPAKGSLTLEKNGSVVSNVTSGSLTELRVSACNDQLAAGMTGPANPVAGGTATAPSAAGSRAAIGAAAGGLTTSIILALIGDSGTPNNCTSSSSAACNYNPPPVSASGP